MPPGHVANTNAPPESRGFSGSPGKGMCHHWYFFQTSNVLSNLFSISNFIRHHLEACCTPMHLWQLRGFSRSTGKKALVVICGTIVDFLDI